MTNPPMPDPTLPDDPFERPDGTPPLGNPGEEERGQERLVEGDDVMDPERDK